MRTILSALLWFVKTMDGGKSGSEKYYYIFFPSDRSTQVDAQNWKVKSQQKTFHIQKPKKKEFPKTLKNFLSLFFGYLYKTRTEGTSGGEVA